MKEKLAIALLIVGPIIIASAFNILFGISGALIAAGVLAIIYGVAILSP